MNRLLYGSLVFAMATALLGAQTPAPSGRGGDPGPDRITRRAKQMRDQLGTGKQVRSHVRVQVRLKNGNRLRGVVKDGRLVERVNGLRFVDAHAADKGAGIRLWYSGGTRNYVFVPFAELQTYNVLQRLTQAEIGEIEAELQMKEVARIEQLRREQLARTAKDKAAEPPSGPAGEVAPGDIGVDGKEAATEKAKAKAKAKAGGATESNDSEKELHRKWFKLLQEFPPAQGWNADKRDEISRRFQVIGARPSAHEQRFVDEFAEWSKACDHFGAEVKASGTQEGSKGKKKGSSRSRGSKK